MARNDRDNGLDLGSFLRRRREEIGLTAGQVAKDSQVYPKSFRISQSFLSEIENSGKMPSPLKLLTLSRLYKITVAEIYQVLGANAEEIGVSLDEAMAERCLYPRESERHIHQQIQKLLSAGMEGPLLKLTEEFRILLDEQRSSMMKVIEESEAQAACVLAGGNILLDVNLTAVERRAFLDRGRPNDDSSWVHFTEGDSDEYSVTLFLRQPQLREPVEATIIVPLVRWWAGLKSVMRRLERRL